jgi:hypothetical protein
VAQKCVLRRAGIEPVDRQRIPAADQLEFFRRHDEMQETFLGAYRAIAIGDARQVRGDAEPHPAAMAAAFVGLRFDLSHHRRT